MGEAVNLNPVACRGCSPGASPHPSSSLRSSATFPSRGRKKGWLTCFVMCAWRRFLRRCMDEGAILISTTADPGLRSGWPRMPSAFSWSCCATPKHPAGLPRSGWGRPGGRRRTCSAQLGSWATLRARQLPFSEPTGPGYGVTPLARGQLCPALPSGQRLAQYSSSARRCLEGWTRGGSPGCFG